MIWAIDPWSAKASSENQEGVNAEYWGNLDHDRVYAGFLSALKAYDVERYVQVIRKKSDEVDPPAVIDFFHCGGNGLQDKLRCSSERFPKRL